MSVIVLGGGDRGLAGVLLVEAVANLVDLTGAGQGRGSETG
jgi:hypothetical protein